MSYVVFSICLFAVVVPIIVIAWPAPALGLLAIPMACVCRYLMVVRADIKDVCVEHTLRIVHLFIHTLLRKRLMLGSIKNDCMLKLFRRIICACNIIHCLQARYKDAQSVRDKYKPSCVGSMLQCKNAEHLLTHAQVLHYTCSGHVHLQIIQFLSFHQNSLCFCKRY